MNYWLHNHERMQHRWQPTSSCIWIIAVNLKINLVTSRIYLWNDGTEMECSFTIAKNILPPSQNTSHLRNFRIDYLEGKMTMIAPIYYPYLAAIDSYMHMHFLNRVKWLIFLWQILNPRMTNFLGRRVLCKVPRSAKPFRFQEGGNVWLVVYTTN